MSIEERKIFVGNLNYNTTDFSFSQHFQMYGEIEDVVILREKNGRSRGCGFITYKEPSMARTALSACTHIIDGRKVDAKTVIPRNANAEKKGENLPKNFQKAYEHLNKLYVSNLGSNIGDEQLKKYFLKYGKIQDAYIAKGPNRRSKGFGFIIFQNKESVEKVQNSRPHWICGKEIATMRGYPDHDSSENKKPSTKLFVMNYKDYIEVRDIEQYFKEFGVIVAVAYKMDTRENKKYTELEFEDYDIVDKIILNGLHTIRGCDVVVKKCLEVISEEQKKESVKKVEVSSKPSRNSSVSRENLKSSNRKQPMTCDKTQNLQKGAQALINKSASSRRSSSLREHFDTSNKQMPDTPNETQNVQNTAPTPCAPPLEDLQNPGRNPSYPISYEAQPHRLYPTISNAEPVSSYPQNSYSNNYSSPNSFPIRNRTPIQRNQSQREEKNGCVIS